MKVIFLDVDGVLNTNKTLKQFGFDFIDPILTALVARIVRETEAKIVLSSTWRLDKRNKTLVEIALKEHDLEIFCSTPVLVQESWTRRKDEILAWLEGKDVERFAILDDFDDAHIEGSFFQTDENVGLTVEITEQVIQHLKS